ncbi:MAG TPA: hypothetical protein LFW21_04840 [Rickettsia endosymbiont of Pyrocoelia pectoralis]|nr:hypothetical protein [Rickettsia endosymbiont of Pyrocoelia pectoralis]
MSKESLKPSINTSEEGVKNAKESNKLNPESVQEQTPEEQKEAGRRVLKDDAKLKGTRMARAGAAAVAVAGATVEAGIHVGTGIAKGVASGNVVHIVEGVAKGGVRVAEGLAKAADPFDKAQKGGKIKEEGKASPGLYDKALNKIRTSVPGGNTIADGLDKTYTVLSSKGVKRMVKVGGAISSVALNPTPIGVGIAALSLTAVAYNVTKETLEVRDDKKLDREKASLENIKVSKQTQLSKIVEAKENIAKNSPELQKFLNTKIPDIYKNPPSPSPDKPFEGSWAKQAVKAVRDTAMETASLFGDAIASGSIAGFAFASATAFINTTGEVDSKIVHMERKNDKINQVNNLKLSAGEYKNEKELQEQERQERINGKALEEFLATTPKIDQLNEQQLRDHFSVTRAKVAESPEFAPPPEKTNFEKVKSAMKAGKDYFVESQFSEVKEVFSKENKQNQTPITPNSSAKVQTPQKNKVQEQTQHMQENLTHGKVNAYSSSISSPQATPTASKHHESSRGR